jgi:hypothetical protein
MPYVPPQLMYVLSLYSKCRANRCLPRAGGLLDQPAWLMELFAVIDATKDAHARAAREKVEQQDALRRIRG